MPGNDCMVATKQNYASFDVLSFPPTVGMYSPTTDPAKQFTSLSATTTLNPSG